MAEVIVAKTAGFCFGVKRAVDTVYEQIKTGDKIYTFGPIIHNQEVIKELSEHGVNVLSSIDDIDDTVVNGIVVIRSHGISKIIQDKLEETGLKIIDATCPFVKKIHNVVMKESNAGKKIVIIGSDSHPEVEGIKGWCNPNNPATVIETAEEAKQYKNLENHEICVVSQTTFNQNKFKELVEIFKNKGYNVTVVNTICNATFERQKEAQQIARQVDSMIVIGDVSSSNTQKLYEICKRECENTQYIQTLDDLKRSPDSISCVGITAGASTPNNIIEEVQKYVRTYF